MFIQNVVIEKHAFWGTVFWKKGYSGEKISGKWFILLNGFLGNDFLQYGAFWVLVFWGLIHSGKSNSGKWILGNGFRGSSIQPFLGRS